MLPGFILPFLLFVEKGRLDTVLAEQLGLQGLLQIDFLPLLSGTNVFLRGNSWHCFDSIHQRADGVIRESTYLWPLPESFLFIINLLFYQAYEINPLISF